MTAFCMFFNCS